jgi:predicted Zn-dependent protease
VQGQLNFSRDMEREADRIGFAVLGLAGFDPAGMAGMFGKLDLANRLNDNGSYPYLRSHPLTLERQSEARLRTQGLAGAAPSASPWMHALMSARARVLMDTSVTALRRLQELPGPRPGHGPADRVAALYASSMASSLLRDHPLAEQQAAAARQLLAAQSSPEPAVQRALWLLDAEGRLAAGDRAGALRVLAQVQQQWPGVGTARPVLMIQAHAALQLQGAGRAEALRQATEALQTWVSSHPRDAMAWLLLGNTAESLGLRLRALRAHAESRLLVGDLTGAIDRLRAGRNLARNTAAGQDFIEASIVDSRLRELEAQRRQLALEARGGRGGPGREPPVERGDPDERSNRGDRPDRPAEGAEPPRPQVQAAAGPAVDAASIVAR